MLYVLCLKTGDKYSATYVNNLKNAVSRHLPIPHIFACLTDDLSGINPGIKIIPLPKSDRITGWWWKTYLFKLGLFPEHSTLLYFDLDMVILNDISSLVTYLPTEFVGMRDVFRAIKPNTHQLGSAVMRWEANTHTQIWSKFFHNPKYQAQFRGDQDWIWFQAKNYIRFYPDEWIRSYKWEVRSKKELVKNDSGNWEFESVRNPEVEPETRVLAFHSTPALHTVKDPIIVRNWR